MKKLIFLLLVFAGFTACENESIQELPQETSVTEGMTAKQSDKIDVCHKGDIINVSINSLIAHQAHGDAVDMDGDGFFDLENECTEGIDCDDTNPNVDLECIVDCVDLCPSLSCEFFDLFIIPGSCYEYAQNSLIVKSPINGGYGFTIQVPGAFYYDCYIYYENLILSSGIPECPSDRYASQANKKEVIFFE